jgi:hypothetical protein
LAPAGRVRYRPLKKQYVQVVVNYSNISQGRKVREKEDLGRFL